MLKTRVLFFGGEGVGKTILLYLLKLNEIIKTNTTIGFHIEDIEYKNRKINIWDIGGGDKKRYLWKHYLGNAKCIVFVINISDKERLDYYLETFNNFLDTIEDNKNIPIIIFGNIFNNKIEFEPEEMLQKSKLPPEISPFIIKGNIFKKEGIPELLDYIYNNIEFIEDEEESKVEEKDEGKDQKKKESYKVTMLGLDDSGKTTLLYLLKLGKKVTTIPTIGYNVEEIDKNFWEKSITIWDIGGKKEIRKYLWAKNYVNTNGLIWVYDLSNNQRIEESQEELKKILKDPQLDKKIPLLIIANKSDLNTNENKIVNFLDGIKDYINNRPYFVKECNINEEASYKEGIAWLYLNFQKI